MKNPVAAAATAAKTTPDRAACSASSRPINHALTSPSGTAESVAQPADANHRPSILWEGGTLPDCVDQAERALLLSGVECYQRGTVMVRPIQSASTTVHGVTRHGGALCLIPVDPAWLLEQMTRAARWVRRGKDGFTAINAPRQVVEAYLARVGQWTVPVLTGIIEAPTLRPDGSILETPGYDAQTGLLLRSPTQFSPLPPEPSRQQAETALALLCDLLAGFPFADPHDKSVALSAVLCGLVRRSIRAAPMHAFRAPKMASGKSLLADVVAMISTGRRAAVIPPASDANEERKRVFAVLLAGDPIACVDNVEHCWSSDVMCSVLTQESFQDRILGESRTLTVPTTTFWMCTGNNLAFRGDLTTRVLPCDLDPKTERPEQRAFDRNLYDDVPARRDALVRAALTILRAHHVAGRPGMGLKPFGRFEEWSGWIRAGLVWLGLPDPCLSIVDLEQSDPIRQHLRAVLSSWHAVFGDKPATVAEALLRARERGDAEALVLLDALEEVAGERGSINLRILGRFLAKYARRIEGGYRLEYTGTYKNAVRWRVLRLFDSPQQELDLAAIQANGESLVSLPHPSASNDDLTFWDGPRQTLQTHAPASIATPGLAPRPVSSPAVLPAVKHAPRGEEKTGQGLP